MLKSFKNITKPQVDFDVNDAQHRAWAADFLRLDSWSHCPVRFAVPPGYGNLVNLIENELACWYTTREFNHAVPTRGDKWAIEYSKKVQISDPGLV